jgi:hypothetical protein
MRVSVPSNYCSNCGEKVPEINIERCPKCDSPVLQYPENLSFAQSTLKRPYKSARKAIIIAIVGGLFGLQGIGHMYVGKLGKGFGILTTGVALILIPFFIAVYLSLFLPEDIELHPLALPTDNNSDSLFVLLGAVAVSFVIGYLLLFVWQVFDVRKLARKFNESVRTTGKEPW